MAMLGNAFVTCEESLAPVVERDGKAYKEYWGMGSSEAKKRRLALDRYQDSSKSKNVDEGIKIQVEMSRSVGTLIESLSSKLKVSMGYVGAENIRDMGRLAGLVVRNPKLPGPVSNR